MTPAVRVLIDIASTVVTPGRDSLEVFSELQRISRRRVYDACDGSIHETR